MASVARALLMLSALHHFNPANGQTIYQNGELLGT